MTPSQRWLLPLVTGLTLLPAPSLFGDDGQIIVRLQPDRIGVGELTELVIEASGDSLLSVPLQPSFELENLEVAGGPSRRQNMSWVNGQVTRTSGLSWYLRATAVGKGRVTAIVVKAGDRELTFPDETIEIAVEPQQRQRSGRGDPFDGLLDDFFRPNRTPPPPAQRPDIRIEAEVSNRTPYTGEQILYTLYLLVESRPAGSGRPHFESIYPRRIPSFEGFWSQDIELPERVPPDSVTRGGKTYWRQPTLRRALFPYNPGPQTIEPAALDLRTIFQQMTRFGPSGRHREDVPVKSGAVYLDVQPLPSPPPGYSGAVGSFSLEATLLPATIEADESATFSFELSGSGQVQGVADPTLVPPPGLRAFPPQSTSRSQVQSRRITNRRSWEFTLVPERTGRYTLEPVEFVFFDPRKAEYVTLASKPADLLVTADTAIASLATPSPPLEGTAVDAPGASVTETGSDVLTAAGLRPAERSLGVAVAAVGGLGLLAGVFLWLRRRACPTQRALLQRLKEACASSQPRMAASIAEEAWRDYLNERFGLPVGQPCSQWSRSLAGAGVSREVADALVELMDDLHYLRYGPQLAASDAMQREFWQRSQHLVRRLPR